MLPVLICFGFCFPNNSLQAVSEATRRRETNGKTIWMGAVNSALHPCLEAQEGAQQLPALSVLPASSVPQPPRVASFLDLPPEVLGQLDLSLTALCSLACTCNGAIFAATRTSSGSRRYDAYPHHDGGVALTATTRDQLAHRWADPSVGLLHDEDTALLTIVRTASSSAQKKQGGARQLANRLRAHSCTMCSLRGISGSMFPLTARGLCLTCEVDRPALCDRWRKRQAAREEAVRTQNNERTRTLLLSALGDALFERRPARQHAHPPELQLLFNSRSGGNSLAALLAPPTTRPRPSYSSTSAAATIKPLARRPVATTRHLLIVPWARSCQHVRSSEPRRTASLSPHRLPASPPACTLAQSGPRRRPPGATHSYGTTQLHAVPHAAGWSDRRADGFFSDQRFAPTSRTPPAARHHLTLSPLPAPCAHVNPAPLPSHRRCFLFSLTPAPARIFAARDAASPCVATMRTRVRPTASALVAAWAALV